MQVKIVHVLCGTESFQVLCVHLNPDPVEGIGFERELSKRKARAQEELLAKLSLPANSSPVILVVDLLSGIAKLSPDAWPDQIRRLAHAKIRSSWRELHDGDVVEPKPLAAV